jgi:hypothetical protein
LKFTTKEANHQPVSISGAFRILGGDLTGFPKPVRSEVFT